MRKVDKESRQNDASSRSAEMQEFLQKVAEPLLRNSKHLSIHAYAGAPFCRAHALLTLRVNWPNRKPDGYWQKVITSRLMNMNV